MRKPFSFYLLVFLLAVLWLPESAGASTTPQPLENILQLQGSGHAPKEKGAFAGIRDKSMREAVFTYALQSAVHWKYEQIKKQLKPVSHKLDRVFDFSVVALDHGRVLPPVITAAGPGWHQLDDTSSKSTKKEFRIERDARVVSTMPTWREYLLKSYPVGDKPNSALFPVDSAERAIWDSAARNGWDEGVKFAFQLYQRNLNKLKRDFSGMIMFHRLENQHLISIPITAENTPRIAVEGRTLSIGEKKFRITLPSHWQAPNKWEPKGALDQ